MKIRCLYKIKVLRSLRIEAITLYPFIFFAAPKEQISENLFRHELEHIYQVERIGVFNFYLSYLRFYIALRRSGLDHQSAYWSIPYEVEARKNEKLSLSDRESEMFRDPLS